MPAPYRLELFQALSLVLGWELRVFFTSATESNRQWEIDRQLPFPCDIVAGFQIRRGERIWHINPTLWRHLAREHPQVVIISGMSTASTVALSYCRRARVPAILWWSGNHLTEKNVSGWKKVWRQWFVRKISGAITYSTGARTYLLELGMCEHNVWNLGNATFDAAKLRAKIDQYRQNTTVQDGQTVPPQMKVLFAGQIIPRKNPLLLPRVLDVLRSDHLDVYNALNLIVVGDGPLAKTLAQDAADIGLGSNLHMAGFVQPKDMLKFYASADVFLHPTAQDHWSQVINEAATAWLGIVTTPYEGAVGDLIVHNTTGKVVEPDPKTLAVAISELYWNRNELHRLGAAAYRRIREIDLPNAVAILQRAVQTVSLA